MIQQIGQLAVRGATLLHRAVDATPLVNTAKNWTQQTATENSVMRRLVPVVIMVVIAMISFTLWKTFDLIMLGKVDVIVGSLLGGIFTFLGGVLAAVLSAFINTPKAVGPNQPVDTTNNSADSQVPPAGN